MARTEPPLVAGMLRAVVAIAALIVVVLLFRSNSLVDSSNYSHLSKLRLAHAGSASLLEAYGGGNPSSAVIRTVASQPHAQLKSELHNGQAERKQPEAPEYVPPQARKRADVVASESASDAVNCPPTRKPYHVVMTAASGVYQEWQSRIAYYHYKKQKRLGGACSDIGGFTRLFNSPDAKPDGMMNEIPTLLVSQLHHGSCAECDHGFIVMNRPWGAVQLVETDYFRTQIAEDYLFLIETDHMMLRPPINAATEERPVGFGFYYMVATDPKLAPVVRRFLAPGIGLETVDAVGPSPLLVHKTMLAKLARPWWELSVQMKLDDEANRVFGWVLEMWGYNLAARNLGIRHTVSQSIQVEPQGVGTDDMADKDIYHYTFGHVLPRWKLDKRMYSGRYPPDHMPPPPLCSAKSAAVIRDLWTEAAQAIPGWKTKVPGENYSALLASQAPLARLTAMPRERSGGLSAMLVGTGPWRWGKLKGLYLFSRGVAFVQPSASAAGVASESAVNKAAHGTWSEGPGGTVALRVCGTTYVLAFADPAAPWTFSATKASDSGAAEARAPGSLSRPDQRGAIMHPLDPALRPGAFGDCGGSGCGGGAGNATLVEEMAGSGPWEWAGFAPFGFMRGGELITPWGTGTWGSTRGAGSEVAPADTVFADFANSQHSIRVLDRTCLQLGSVRKMDGEKVSLTFPVLEGQYGADEPHTICADGMMDQAVLNL